MEKPAYVKEDVWRFLLTAFNKISDDKIYGTITGLGYEIKTTDSRESVLEKISEEPAAFLNFADLLDHPDLMKNMIVGIISDKRLDIELEYVVTQEAVEALKAQKEFIILDRLGGPHKDIAITKEGLAENLARHCTIDYLEKNK